MFTANKHILQITVNLQPALDLGLRSDNFNMAIE